MSDRKKFALILFAFLFFYFIPADSPRVSAAASEALAMLHEYAREHVLLCLVPAFFIAGAISVFISQQSVMKYLGSGANKFVSYSVAAVSGTILAVCSCTVLPLFAGIYARGAGIGPASTFLYSGPAINVLAIILTARVLGFEMGLARAIGAISFSIVIGLAMSFIFRKDEEQRREVFAVSVEDSASRPLWQPASVMAGMICFLIFANIAAPKVDAGFWAQLHSVKWTAALISLSYVVFAAGKWFKEEISDWFRATWGYALQVLPLLFAGVLIAGFLFGRPGREGIIPSAYVSYLVGGNSIFSNFFASIVGALMYFATLTEVPILQGLLGAGMGKGPALALLLAGPALSLPSMLVIKTVLGTKKTLTYVALVVLLSSLAGMIYGSLE